VLGLSRSQYSLSQRIQQLMRQLEAIVRHTAGEMTEALKLRDELTGLADRSKAEIDGALQAMIDAIRIGGVGRFAAYDAEGQPLQFA